MRSRPYCVLSGQPVHSALRDRRGVTVKGAERGFVERGAPAGLGWFAPKALSPRMLPLWPPRLSGAGGQTLCSAGGGGHLPGEATALLLSDPDFQPHTHSMFFSLWLSGVLFLKGFLFWLVFWIFLSSFFFFFFSPCFVSSFVFPGFVLDVDAVFCP